MNGIIIAITVLYFSLMIAIGLWANRRTKSTKDFLIAGQTLGVFVVAIAAFASIQSGWGMVGNTGTLFGWGIQGIFTTSVIAPLGFLLAWALLGSRLRRIAERHEVYSVPDIIRVRYGHKAAQITVSIAVFLGSVGYMMTQIIATGLIMSLLFGFSFSTGVWIGAGVVGLYTVVGGMIAAVWTDLIQGVLMIIMSVIIFFIAIGNVGGWGSMLDTLYSHDPALVSAMGVMPLTYIFSSALMVVFGVAGQPQFITKFLMIRDTKELRWGALICSVAYFITTFFALGIGLSVRAMVVEGRLPDMSNIDDALPTFFSSPDIIAPIFAALGLITLLAAIMSSASSFITIGASAIMRDLASALNIKVKHDLFWGRFYAAIVVIVSVLAAIYLDQIIFILGVFGWAAFAASTFGPIVLGIYWKRATGTAAFVSMVIGLSFNLIITVLTAREFFTVPEYFFAGGVTFAIGVLVFIFVSFFTQSSDNELRFENLYPEKSSFYRGGNSSEAK